jgi:hypothetical protein
MKLLSDWRMAVFKEILDASFLIMTVAFFLPAAAYVVGSDKL